MDVSPDGLLEVGRIEKVHGLKGELQVALVTNMVEARTAPGARFWADGEPLLVELIVDSARPHKNKWLMRFEGVTVRESAEPLRGRTLLAQPLPADALGAGTADGMATEVVAFVHDLIDKTLIDQHGQDHGPVVAVVDNPASDLLELADGRLVPLTFYRHHDDRSVTVDVPLGLLDGDPVVDSSAGDGSP